MNERTILSLLSSIALTACAVAPTVQYNVVKSPADLRGDEIDSFYLQRSIIKIDNAGTKKNVDGKDAANIVATSIPAEFTDFKVSIRPAGQPGIKTNLNIAKRPNTELVAEAGVEVIDTRVEIINKLGTIITTAAKHVPFNAATGLEPDRLPKAIQVDVVLKANKVGREARPDIDAADGVTIDFGPIPPDANTIDKLPANVATSVMVYSACREATVKFKYKDNNYTQTMKVADPNFFGQVAFPVKGKLSFHSECGVSVSSDKDTGVSSNAVIIEALATQGKAIKDAIDAAKKEKEDAAKKDGE